MNINIYNKLTETIKGKTALMVCSFCVILILFSAFVYVETQKISKDFREYKNHWHPLQVNFFTTIGTITLIQAGILEAIATHNANMDDTGYDNPKDIGFLNLNFTSHFDSLDVDFDYKTPISDFRNIIIDVNTTKKQIFERIIFLKSQNRENEINSDTLINVHYFKIWKERINTYWGVFFSKLLNQIQDRAEAKAQKIKDDLLQFSIKILIFSVLVLIIYIYVWRKFILAFKKSIKQPIDALHQISNGELKIMDIKINDELAEVVEATNILSSNLTKASDFSIEIGKSNFDFQFEPISENDTLGLALIHMRDELKRYAEKEKQSNWVNLGLAKFAHILRNSNASIEEISYTLLTELIKYLNFNQGGIFIYEESLNLLQMKACYAYERKKYYEKDIKIGEGLVGQCYIEEDTIYLTDIPQDYISITSGLGRSNPKTLLLMPMIDNSKVFGVIELASFQDLEDYQIEFVKKVAENFASVIQGIFKNELTKSLLEESNLVRQTLKQQEEEMRQNLEELMATQEEMHRKEKNYIDEINTLKVSNSI